MKTAIQQAIENALTAKDNDKKDTVTYQEVIDMLTEFLPTEQEQIEQAYYDGGDNMCPNGEAGNKKAKQYYTETFKNDK